MQRIVSASAKRTLTVEVDRARHPDDADADAQPDQGQGRVRQLHLPGHAGRPDQECLAAGGAAVERGAAGAVETWNIVDRTFSFIAGLARGTECPDQVGGVWKIAEVSGQVATQGFLPWLHLVGVLSVSIGLFNPFPVPLLDGGHACCSTASRP